MNAIFDNVRTLGCRSVRGLKQAPPEVENFSKLTKHRVATTELNQPCCWVQTAFLAFFLLCLTSSRPKIAAKDTTTTMLTTVAMTIGDHTSVSDVHSVPLHDGSDGRTLLQLFLNKYSEIYGVSGITLPLLSRTWYFSFLYGGSVDGQKDSCSQNSGKGNKGSNNNSDNDATTANAVKVSERIP